MFVVLVRLTVDRELECDGVVCIPYCCSDDAKKQKGKSSNKILHSNEERRQKSVNRTKRRI
jgi:hypothetical protein